MKEDYVSFKVAKLLKENGFDGDCIVFYKDSQAGLYEFKNASKSYKDKLFEPCFLAPTHQMVMKWLREKYNIHIEIRYQGYKEYSYKYYINNLKADEEDNKYKFFGTHYMQPINENKTYESACESAIEWCLTNLI